MILPLDAQGMSLLWAVLVGLGLAILYDLGRGLRQTWHGLADCTAGSTLFPVLSSGTAGAFPLYRRPAHLSVPWDHHRRRAVFSHPEPPDFAALAAVSGHPGCAVPQNPNTMQKKCDFFAKT